MRRRIRTALRRGFPCRALPTDQDEYVTAIVPRSSRKSRRSGDRSRPGRRAPAVWRPPPGSSWRDHSLALSPPTVACPSLSRLPRLPWTPLDCPSLLRPEPITSPRSNATTLAIKQLPCWSIRVVTQWLLWDGPGKTTRHSGRSGSLSIVMPKDDELHKKIVLPVACTSAGTANLDISKEQSSPWD